MNWKEDTKSFIKTELINRNLNSEDLVCLLDKIGVKETKASIDNKISRGSFSATFFLQCIHAFKLSDSKRTYLNTANIDQNIVKDIEIPYQYNLFKEKNELLYTNHKEKLRYLDITKITNSKFRNNKVVSLFTGAGGLDIGLEMAGFDTEICIEIDEDSRETIRQNRPNWKLFEENNDRIAGDIRTIHPEEVLKEGQIEKGEIAIVVGGAPCQPFSNIGMKKGKHDPKNGDLFLEFVKMVKGILPKAFLFENVVGITQSKHTDVIKYMTEKLEGLGYGISYTILNAANYGVGQRRERFFLLGIKNVDKPAFPLPTHYKGLKEWKTFTQNLNKLPSYIPVPWVTLEDIFKGIPKGNQNREDYALMNISDVVVNRMRMIKQGENFKVLPMAMRPNCWKSGKHQGNDTFGRLKIDEPAITIRTAAYNPAKGKYIHPTENRGLSTIEMAAIQSFPSEWIFKSKNRKRITLKSGGMQIGNAVPPLLAKALGLSIREQIEQIERISE
jgi:DNA (cytosine-5)-methyltransferase 1